jgi:thioredoxin-related protein
MRPPLRAFLVAIAFLAAGQSMAQAAELVMVELRSCVYCAKFQREVAPTYQNTDAGKRAPLRLVSPLKTWPSDLAGIRQAPYTPVFILVDKGREIGRFAGYTDSTAFWTKLNSLLGRLQHG